MSTSDEEYRRICDQVWALYQAQIEKPIRAYLKRHAGIDFIVLTKGVPIRIDGGETGEDYGFDAPQESVDGALAALDYDKIGLVTTGIDANGKLQTPQSFGWDILTNKATNSGDGGSLFAISPAGTAWIAGGCPVLFA